MEKGDLVKCCTIEDYGKIALVLEHDHTSKTVKVYFQDSKKIKVLYSRDAQLYKISPKNKLILDKK
jgi:formylmethanofuran dehydrogenase subunit E